MNNNEQLILKHNMNQAWIDADNKEKTNKSLEICDAMAETWAEEIGLDALVGRITKCDESKEKVKALMLQAHVEGLYRGRMSATT